MNFSPLYRPPPQRTVALGSGKIKLGLDRRGRHLQHRLDSLSSSLFSSDLYQLASACRFVDPHSASHAASLRRHLRVSRLYETFALRMRLGSCKQRFVSSFAALSLLLPLALFASTTMNSILSMIRYAYRTVAVSPPEAEYTASCLPTVPSCDPLHHTNRLPYVLPSSFYALLRPSLMLHHSSRWHLHCHQNKDPRHRL